MLGFTRWYGKPMAPDEWIPGPPPAKPPDFWWIDPPEWINPATGEWESFTPAPDAVKMPSDVAAPCRCGCPNFWEDVGGNLHCASCVKIPGRAAASGRAWCVLWSPDGCRWEDWTPVNGGAFLFAHIDAAEKARIAALPPDDF